MLTSLLDASHTASLAQLPSLAAEHAGRVGLHRLRMYVADLQEDVLREVTGRGPDAGEGGRQLRIDATLPGRAFRSVRILQAVTGGRQQSWVPILDGTERIGVLSCEPAEPGPEAEEVMAGLASLLGLLLVSKRAVSDSLARLCRTRPMTVSAEMQWTLMPPKTFANHRMMVSAAMEPAYETAGDAFDYAEANGTAHLAVFDAMGHDTAAGLTANLAVAACRSGRRQGADLIRVREMIEDTLVEQFGRSRYATGILADLDLGTGMLSWINCGHLPPVVIRGGRTATTLRCRPTHPLGTGLGLPVTLCRDQLEPGDRLLLYTDGITEARAEGGEQFGVQRFTDFIIRHEAGKLPVPETLRRLVHAVLDYHGGAMRDDATVLVCEWPGAAPDRLRD
ncbi:serine/threonine-protein phosphatase [Streptomyces sp. F63]|nr:serine/threonine-protein phosphatase [Streptomyces sp. F63]